MKNIVLVTGGSGFLGQHVIKELQEAKDFDEIRVFDLHPYENKTGMLVAIHPNKLDASRQLNHSI